jgi:hypothetical protein
MKCSTTRKLISLVNQLWIHSVKDIFVEFFHKKAKTIKKSVGGTPIL